MATVLVTGATGFLGQHLVRQLRGRDVAVRGLSRSAAGDAALAALGASAARGELNDVASLDAAAAGVDAVFHTAVDTNRWAPNNAAQTRCNVEGTRALVGAAQRAGVRAFVHTSSVSSFSHLVHGTLNEATPRRGGESWINYERTKFLAENVVRDAMAQGLPAIVLYPAHIFGPGDTRNWARLVQLIDRGQLPGAPPGSGAFADVREVARAHIDAWEGARFGESYLLGGEHASFVDLINRIGTLLGRKTPRKPTPAWVLMTYARVLDAVSRLTRREPSITPEAATFTCHDLHVDSSRAQREIGYRITPLDRLLKDTVEWMRGAGMLSPA
jgi:dihydroflavonol-4-reductase